MSVRDRIEREQCQQETPAPARPRKSGVAGNSPTASTREFTSGAEFQTAGPEVLPKLGPRAGGMTANASMNTTVRSRLDQQRAMQEAKSEQPTRTAIAEFYLREYEIERQQKADREAREAREQNERIANERRVEAENARMFGIRLAFDQAPGGSATPDERRRVMTALKKFPDADGDKALSVLMTLRGAI